MKKKVLIGIIIMSVLIIALAIFSGDNSNTNTTISGNTVLSTIDFSSSDSNQDTTSAKSTSTQPLVSVEELKKHSQSSDCWISYKGKVYDVTTFLPKHPGSAAAIMPYCGTASEFEKAFTAKHGTSKASLLMKVGVFMGDFEIVGNI